MQKYIKFALAATLGLLILVSTSFGFTVTGAILEREVSPGQEFSHKITVANSDTNATLTNYTANIYGFARTSTGGNIEIPPDQDIGSFTARPFLTIEPDRFSLAPGATQILFLNGTMPEYAGAGGKYALAAIMTEPKPSEYISISTAIEVPIYLTIKDSDIIQRGNITEMDAAHINEGLAVNITLENTGNIHYKPVAEAVLKDQTGQILAETKIKANAVLPANSYLFQLKLAVEGDISPGNYIVGVNVILEDGTVLDSKETEFEI